MSVGHDPSLVLPPVSLYIHIPWCVRKCPYCDFNSHAAQAELPQQRYVDTLLRDFESESPLLQGRPIETIFFGGGTPSLIQPAQIRRLLDGIRGMATMRPGAEITLEANPGTVDQGHFAGFRAAGINRISIGIQSFDDASLKALGRIHSADQTCAAFQAARDAGFENINLDLMHGLPGQSPDQASRDLQTAIELEPEHLSWYQLTIEPNTEFYSRPPELPDEDRLERIENRGLKQLATAGFRRYEVSAYAKPGKESRHNLNYWRFGDYLGIGAGAHGKLTLPDSGELIRTTKTRLPGDYLAAAFPQEHLRKPVEPQARTLEFMMNWLRLGDSLDLQMFSDRTGSAPESLATGLESAVQQGLMEAETFRPTPLGMRFLNQLTGLFQA